MNTLQNLNGVRVVKVGSSLRERLERQMAKQHHKAVIARLRRFREGLECDMDPEPWTVLQSPMVLLLADVCKALALTEKERAIILGEEGERALANTLETQFIPRPQDLNERQAKALTYVQQHGKINISAYRRICPGLSDETLRLDLVGLTECGLLRKNGAKRGTYYTQV